MKNRFLANIFRAAPAALLLAAAFVPLGSARGEIYFDVSSSDTTLETGSSKDVTIKWNEEELDHMEYMRGTTLRYRSVVVSASPSGLVTLQKLDANNVAQGEAGDSVTLASDGSSQNAADYYRMSGKVRVVGKAPGTVTLTVVVENSDSDDSYDSVELTIEASDTLAFLDDSGNAITQAIVGEGNPTDEAKIVRLSFGYELSSPVTFTVTSSDDGSHLSVEETSFTANGVSTYNYRYRPLDGSQGGSGREINLTFTGDTAYTSGATFKVFVTNNVPSLSYPSTDENNPSSMTSINGARTPFTAEASDVESDLPLNWRWYFNGVQLSTATYGNTNSINYTVNSAGTMTVVAYDKDGGISQTGHWNVELSDAARVTINDKVPFSSITDAQGGGAAVFYTDLNNDVFQDDVPNDYNPAGNYFTIGSSFTLRAEPTDSTATINGTSVSVPSYRFGWYVGDSSAVTDPLSLNLPNEDETYLNISVSSDTSVRYWTSRPYLGYYDETTLQPIDNFGDIDQDGLSDQWEATYLSEGATPNSANLQDGDLPALMNATGAYGSSGTSYSGGDIVVAEDTLDNDRLPTKVYEDIENVWTNDPYYVEGAGNIVRVYKYPLVSGNSYVNYGTYLGTLSDVTLRGSLVYLNADDTIVDSTDKPFFDNLTEFRGIPQATSANTAGAWPGSANFVRVGYPKLLTRATLENRGNCPGTDPKVDDTDGDGRGDGWEFYFWSTILYENKPEYWRAYDPTFSSYPEVMPGGTADFRAAGIPLLRRDVTNEDAVVYSDGSFVRYPDESFTPTIIRSDCYYGYPVIAENGGSGARLANCPVSGLAYVDEIYTEEGELDSYETHAAVEFTMGSLKVFTRPGCVDVRGRATLWYQPHQDQADADVAEAPLMIEGAYVDLLNGEFHLPGRDYFPEYIQGLIGDRDATVTARYRTINGIFPKQYLLNKFDPNSNLSPNFSTNAADIVRSIGLNASLWDPDSDLDNDGIPDFDEYFLGTNPLHWDTDNDGMPDGWELLFGLDPHDPKDATANPDGDYMYATGPYRHVDAFLYDYLENQTYWNGQTSLGFIPGAAAYILESEDHSKPFTSFEEFYVVKWLIGKEGAYPSFTSAVYPTDWQRSNSDGEPIVFRGTDPMNDDTDADHIPDGWALYMGYKPNALKEGSTDNEGLSLVEWVYYRLNGKKIPDERRSDPDRDGLGWLEEFQNWNTYNYLNEHGSTNSASRTADWYKPTFGDNPVWTWKKLPTCPWIWDTDGDGIPDGYEYMETDVDGYNGYINFNGDTNLFVNLNPCSADTDLDRLPDGWEMYGGLYDASNGLFLVDGVIVKVDDQFGPYGDPDCDGLSNYQEYLTGAVYGWRYDKWYSPDDKTLWAPDPSMTADAIEAAVAADARIGESFSAADDAFPYGRSVHFRKYQASDFMRPAPSPRFLKAATNAVARIEARWAETSDGWTTENSPTMGDLEAALSGPDGNTVVSPWANWYQRAWAIMQDSRSEVYTDVLTGQPLDNEYISASENEILGKFLDVMLTNPPDFSYGCIPAEWESKASAGTVRVVKTGVNWAFIPNNFFGTQCYAGTHPRRQDSDNDGMDDFWEIFHGLNPIYGGSYYGLTKAGTAPDSDRADVHAWGNGSKNDWIMGNDSTFVLNLDANGLPATRVAGAFTTPLGTHVASSAYFDYKTRPWLAGDPTADPDQDGLSNQEECYNERMNDVLHHTDPSPYWFTDVSYAESYVNLYYALDDEMATTRWWWPEPIDGTAANGPSYLFDFEMGEGFDTDNDNISDRAEISGDSGVGTTDPLDLDSPRARKAMYFDGNRAAVRTRNPFFHDKWSLTSYTVEFWCRPQTLPGPGKLVTLLQRPVYMPVDDSSAASRYQIRHTFLVQLDELGQIVATVDNDALETSSSATVISTGRLAPDTWTHVAVVMDSVGNTFTVYLNGATAGIRSANLKPCTGFIGGAEYISATNFNSNASRGERMRYYDYSPAPIVIGAYDKNPWGVVAGSVESAPWGLPDISAVSQPDFDEDQFFNGWIDEVRIWDRCRTHDQIRNSMSKRFSKDDIDKINHERFRWEMQGVQTNGFGIAESGYVGKNLFYLTTMDDIPQKLLYHYSFDNLPDVVLPDEGRDIPARALGLFAADASVAPSGWDSDAVSRYRPVPFWTAPEWYPYASTTLAHLVPWWYSAKDRSSVYTDFSYVPFVENTVAHMPQTPALDMRGIIPVYDLSEVDVTLPNGNRETMESWTLKAYRRRTPADWLIYDRGLIPFLFAFGVYDGATQLDIDPAQIANSMNPYVMTYRTAFSDRLEVHPANFPGELDDYGVYRSVPVLSDALPLNGAVADIDVPMWDGLGAGTEVVSIDTDGDGLPDWWEIAYGLDPNSADGDYGAHADLDGDGLDNYAEYLAGTDPTRIDSDSDGYSDYYSRADGSSLTWGELYDDGDGMPNDWEIEYGLDPDRYDADEDLDVDGWTNWEEYMAGTDPSRADEYPDPALNATIHYSDSHQEEGKVYIHTYSEKRASHVFGGVTNNWGGAWDGRYYGTKTETGTFTDAEESQITIGNTFLNAKAVKLASSDISIVDPPRITVNRRITGRTTLTASAWSISSDYLVFVDDTEDLLIVDYRKGILYLVNRYPAQRTSGNIYGDFSITYTVSANAYPLTISGMQRDPSTHIYQHIVSGNNRFFGWLDLDSNGEYDIGEPAGISLYRPTLVSWDSIDVEIPLTDELFGFPRLSWPTNNINGLATRYVVKMWLGANQTKSALETGAITASPGIRIEAPRNYLHEGDFIDAGIRGICLQENLSYGVVHWQVTGRLDKDGDISGGYEDVAITNGTFEISFLDNNGQRRTMEAVTPVGGNYGENSILEFKWKMDWRTEGVFFTVKDENGSAVAGLNNLYVPFPVRHGSRDSEDYFYTAVPQLENGLTAISLPAGNYTYTIKENLRTTSSAVKVQTVSGSFTIQGEDGPKSDLYAQYGHSASGSVEYFGKVSGGLTEVATSSADEICAGPTFDGSAWSWADGDVSGDSMIVEFSSDVSGIVPGSMVVEITYPTSDGTVTERLNDRATTVETDGTLYAESGEKVWSGSIRYPESDGEKWTVKIVFDSRLEAPPSGTTISVLRKSFRAPLVIQAFKLSETATNSFAVSGHPVAELRQETKGAFEFTGLASGNYAFRAFIDSNGNGAPDDWETQGFASIYNNASPVLMRSAELIKIESTDVNNLRIVLHDRDTDDDMLPDSWEYEMWGSIAAHTGQDSADASGTLLFWQEYADGPLDSDPRSPDTDFDGLTDAMELIITGTDTHSTDTDGDGVGDLEEFLSGSDPLSASEAVPYTMPALEFDADGVPFVDCPYPALPRGVTLAYTLQRKASLDDKAWDDVAEMVVAATPQSELVVTVADGVSMAAMPAGVARMTPADGAETVDWTSGFFRTRVFADYGKMVENDDGTYSFWTWVGTTGAFEEVARGTGVLERDIDGNWAFVDKASNSRGSLVRHPDGTWSFVR